MEVHHPHHPTHKKKWSEYILEFFMLFVAVTLGFFAENIREHYVEKHKAIENVQNLYKDLKTDSVIFSYMVKIRNKQDSSFQIISRLYDQKKIDQDISTLYVAHSFLALRIMPTISTMALDQLKNSGALNYIEDERLKQEIQLYANNAVNLKIREEREYNFIDKNIDPLTINRFEYKYYQELSKEDDFEITDTPPFETPVVAWHEDEPESDEDLEEARIARSRGHKAAAQAGSMKNLVGRAKDWFLGNF